MIQEFHIYCDLGVHDVHVEAETGNIYELQEGGIWSTACTRVAPIGPTGETGLTGETGQTGETG